MTPTLHLKLGVTLVTVFRGGLYRGMMRAGGGEGRFWQPRWQKFGGSKFITETLHWLFWRSCHILWMDCTFGFYLEIHILNPSLFYRSILKYFILSLFKLEDLTQPLGTYDCICSAPGDWNIVTKMWILFWARWGMGLTNYLCPREV